MIEQQSVPSHEHTASLNPATGEILGHSSLTTEEELKQMIENAKMAQKSWADLTIGERVRYMYHVRDYIVQNAEEISDVISRDNGKTRVDAISTEVLPVAMAIDYYAKKAKKFLKERQITPGNILLFNKRSRIIRIPYGVIGVISPWNYPFAIPFYEIVMGLLAGNAVVLKAASETQIVGRKLEECFLMAKLPEGVFNYVNMPGRLVGSALLKNGIDKLFFTGSVEVAKNLMREAGETLTPLVFELGGNDAMLVCEDADVHRAVTGAIWGGLSNCGQSCSGVERIYVHQNIYDQFLNILKVKVEALRVGNDQDFNVDLGVMTTQRQISKVKRHLEDALSKGATIFARSIQPEENNLLPAYVLTDVHHGMLVMQEETFGPILGVMKVKDMDEAVALANDSHLGLSGSVWSKNRKYAKKLARQIEAGAILINDHLMNHGMAETPLCGFKMSGIGCSHGAIGFDEMTQPKVIINDIMPFARQNMWWHPHGKKVYQGLLGAIKFLYAKSLVHRLMGLRALLKIIPRFFLSNFK